LNGTNTIAAATPILGRPTEPAVHPEQRQLLDANQQVTEFDRAPQNHVDIFLPQLTAGNASSCCGKLYCNLSLFCQPTD
jgi:hypothetical protein